MRSGTKLKIGGILVFCGMCGIILVVALPILYIAVISGGVSGMVLTAIPLGFGFEWALSSLLTVSLVMISGGGRK